MLIIFENLIKRIESLPTTNIGNWSNFTNLIKRIESWHTSDTFTIFLKKESHKEN